MLRQWSSAYGKGKGEEDVSGLVFISLTMICSDKQPSSCLSVIAWVARFVFLILGGVADFAQFVDAADLAATLAVAASIAFVILIFVDFTCGDASFVPAIRFPRFEDLRTVDFGVSVMCVCVWGAYRVSFVSAAAA